jgi:signal transduction histidine kinase
VKVIEYLSRKSPATVLLMGLVMVLYVGAVDYVTGQVMMLIFYLVPVCFVAWFAGRSSGVVTACAAGLAWYGAKYMDATTVEQHFMLLWNFLMRVLTFAGFAALTSEVAERKRVEQELRRAQEGLERRVRERTQELAQANEALQAQVAERTAAQGKLKLLNETLEEQVAQRSADAEERARQLARSEAALRRQTGILQSILNSMGDGVIVADANAKILLFNPAAERLLRASLGDIPPEHWLEHYETYLPGTLTAYPSNDHPLLRAVRGEVIDGAEIFLRRSNVNEGVWLSATGRPLVDENGHAQGGGVVVFSDITPRKLLEKQIAEVSDREQRRIGQDLHDSLCQHLVSAAFASEFLRDKLARQKLAEAAQAERILDIINEGISQARTLARGLYPVRLEIDGLASALEELAAASQTRSRIPCHFSCDQPVTVYDEVAGVNLYRIAQEAVNNALKHSRARHISIGLGSVEQEVTLTVKDDGVGFPQTLNPRGGMGLSIMNYRAKMIGASLDIRRAAAGGTIVICSFHNEKAADKPNLHSRVA